MFEVGDILVHPNAMSHFFKVIKIDKYLWLKWSVDTFPGKGYGTKHEGIDFKSIEWKNNLDNYLISTNNFKLAHKHNKSIPDMILSGEINV